MNIVIFHGNTECNIANITTSYLNCDFYQMEHIDPLLVYILIVAMALIFIFILLMQRKRVKLLKEQIGSAKRIIEIEETAKGKTAREIHDLAGQLVLGISGMLENIDFPEPEDKEEIKANVKELGTSLRLISHQMNRAMIEHFTLSEMISGLCADVQKLMRLKIDLEIPDEFSDMEDELIYHFYRITQELLTNAGQYARESNVKIKIFTDDDKLTLHYSDDGCGFTPGEKSKQNLGILYIFERTKLLGGQANLTSAPGKGTFWEIILPLYQK